MHLRKALRNYHYSKHLNFWIDLIFGSKQQKKKLYERIFRIRNSKILRRFARRHRSRNSKISCELLPAAFKVIFKGSQAEGPRVLPQLHRQTSAVFS
mmetsp:Transcript_18042/g.20800  ORF Transcript_18042/g.20800 Transcript_18042/m.20800 type:complete len:97 (-) Transcript_18042:234-524(-)